MGTSELPEIYAQARGYSPSASVYISGKSQVPMFQLIHLGVSPASVHGNCRNVLRVYLHGTM